MFSYPFNVFKYEIIFQLVDSLVKSVPPFSVSSQLKIIIIIISLFQEDNIFGTNASLTYGPRLRR